MCVHAYVCASMHLTKGGENLEESQQSATKFFREGCPGEVMLELRRVMSRS